jgi:hypothetical protein
MQRKLIVVALLIATAGFIAQTIAGVIDTPTIPPSLVAIIAAEALPFVQEPRTRTLLSAGASARPGRRSSAPARI